MKSAKTEKLEKTGKKHLMKEIVVQEKHGHLQHPKDFVMVINVFLTIRASGFSCTQIAITNY